MTVENKAQGCLLGLACGDALGRPVEFKNAGQIESEYGTLTEMVGNGSHGQPAGTITDDTEMALCIAHSLVDSGGFDPGDVGEQFVDWLDSDPFDIGLMTRESLSRLRQGTPWNEVGLEVWESRPEGSNAGNGSVMRCAPYGIAFRHFEGELTHVSQLSSAITHADPRCQWGCVFLNRTLANLLRGENEPLGTAIKGAYDAPDELRNALSDVYDVTACKQDTETVESQLSTSGYVVDSLQAGLYYGLTAPSVESAITQAVNSGGDTDTVGAIAGAVAGARFGATNVPDRWVNEIEETGKLKRLAEQLLAIRQKIPGKEYASLDDDSLIFKQRTIDGPAYISVREFQEATIGHRPHPAPHRTIRREYHELTAQTAAMLDWERRAYAVKSGRCVDYAGPQTAPKNARPTSPPVVVPVPQYPFVESFAKLPEIDQQWIKRDGRAVGDAFIRAYAAFAGVRHPITDTDTETIDIKRMDPIAGATRIMVGTFDTAGELLLQTNLGGGYASPEEINEEYDAAVAEKVIADYPHALYELLEMFPELASGAAAILDYLTQLRITQQQQTLTDTGSAEQLTLLRNEAQAMVGELHVMSESIRRVLIRHPDLEYTQWKAAPTVPGGES